jgi:hypothetical protein
MTAHYIILYEQYHDNGRIGSNVFASPEDAINFAKVNAPYHHDIDTVVILEIGDKVSIGAAFKHEKDGSLTSENLNEWQSWLIGDGK